MPPQCSICNHPDRAQIDQALVEGVSLRTVEARHSGTTRSALDRHRKHIPAALAQAKQASETADSMSLLSRVACLTTRCERFLDRVERSGEHLEVAAAFRELHRYLKLLGEISGELQAPGARVAITFNEIQNLNVAALTKEQVGLIYDRIQSEQIREVQGMTNAELETELFKILGVDGAARGGSINPPAHAPAQSPQVIEGR